jgi:two-component system chemotaxis response regulator CheB
MLAEDPEINVKASLYNGEVALKYLSSNKDVDVVVLDIEMPVMSGMEALPQMLKLIPNLKVIMFSTLTTQNARISIDALDLGAADYVAKPSTNKDFISKDQFKRELLEKVKTFARLKEGRDL